MTERCDFIFPIVCYFRIASIHTLRTTIGRSKSMEKKVEAISSSEGKTDEERVGDFNWCISISQQWLRSDKNTSSGVFACVHHTFFDIRTSTQKNHVCSTIRHVSLRSFFGRSISNLSMEICLPIHRSAPSPISQWPQYDFVCTILVWKLPFDVGEQRMKAAVANKWAQMKTTERARARVCGIRAGENNTKHTTMPQFSTWQNTNANPCITNTRTHAYFRINQALYGFIDIFKERSNEEMEKKISFVKTFQVESDPMLTYHTVRMECVCAVSVLFSF